MTGTRSLAEFRDRIRRHLPSARPEEWITGSGWDETLWPTKRLPTRLDIDAVTSDHPVFLVRIDGHVAVANTLALKIAHVGASREVPQGGEIVRDADGNPNGLLRETAQSLVARIIPPPTPGRQRQAIEAALADLARSGITSAQDFSGGDEESNLANFKILEQLEKKGS